MSEQAPSTITHAGELVFLEVDHPWPLKLLVLLAGGWVFLGPLLVFSASRQARTWRGLVVYAAGLLAAIATLMAVEWGWPTTGAFIRRFGVLWRHLGLQFLGLGVGLAVVAALLGGWTRFRVAGRKAR